MPILAQLLSYLYPISVKENKLKEYSVEVYCHVPLKKLCLCFDGERIERLSVSAGEAISFRIPYPKSLSIEFSNEFVSKKVSIR
ncbi:MAG: hypothetical protein QW035_00455 [Candidatus Anstonellales archaeon]